MGFLDYVQFLCWSWTGHQIEGVSVLEDMAVCMSKCASDVANGTGVKSGVSWMPDGVSLIHLIHQEQSPMVTSFGKLLFHNGVICWSSSLCFNPTFAK